MKNVGTKVLTMLGLGLMGIAKLISVEAEKREREETVRREVKKALGEYSEEDEA